MRKIKYLIVAAVAAAALSSCEQSIQKNSGPFTAIDPTKVPTGAITGDTSGVTSSSAVVEVTVGNGNGSAIIDAGVILLKDKTGDFTGPTPPFTIGTAGVKLGVIDSAQAGETYEVAVNGLTKGTNYYYKAYTMNANGITYGEVKTFTTPELKTPWATDFSDREESEWFVLEKDGYIGDDPDLDWVWWDNPADYGAVANWGKALCIYTNATENRVIWTVVSPEILITNANDSISFNAYLNLFGGSGGKMNVYVTEDPTDLGTPVRTLTYTTGSGNLARTAAGTVIPVGAYLDKRVYVALQVTRGNFMFYRFAIAPTSDVNVLFPWLF